MQLAPAAAFIPQAWQGRPIVVVLACHTGDAAAAEKALAPLRAFRRPIVDTIARKPYVEHQKTFDAGQPDGLHQYWKSEFIAGLSGGVLDTFRQQAAEIPSPMCQLWLIQLGGAVADHEHEATPFGNRNAEHICMVASASPPDARGVRREPRSVDQGQGELRPRQPVPGQPQHSPRGRRAPSLAYGRND